MFFCIIKEVLFFFNGGQKFRPCIIGYFVPVLFLWLNISMDSINDVEVSFINLDFYLDHDSTVEPSILISILSSIANEKAEDFEAYDYNADTDTYIIINVLNNGGVQRQIENLRVINYAYIEKVKERHGTLSEIINTLNLIKECINKVYAGNLKVRLLIDIYDYFESILEIINEKRNDDFYIIYKAKDTLKKIEEAIEQEQKLNKKGFDEFYDAIKDENWFDEEFDKIYEFVDCADVLIEEIFYIVSLLDNSSEYKIERKKSRYRKKGFKKKSSKYFKLLSEGHTFEDISKICGINIESVKKFFKRKLKEYKSSMNDDEIATNWTITKDQLNFFITFMLKKEGK